MDKTGPYKLKKNVKSGCTHYVLWFKPIGNDEVGISIIPRGTSLKPHHYWFN